jgi:hypothetical protein
MRLELNDIVITALKARTNGVRVLDWVWIGRNHFLRFMTIL